jgi:hypothetical protein
VCCCGGSRADNALDWEKTWEYLFLSPGLISVKRVTSRVSELFPRFSQTADMAGGPVRATIGLEYPPGSEFRDLFLITELLDSKAESDDVAFEAELARMPCQIEWSFRFVEVRKKAAADPSNRSSIDPPLFRLSRSGSNSCCQSSLSIVS